MDFINRNKAVAQQWKAVINQDFNNGLTPTQKKEVKVKLRQWASYIERVLSPKNEDLYRLMRVLASMNAQGKIFAPFDRPPNDTVHTGRFLDDLGKKLFNAGLSVMDPESERGVIALDTLNLIQKIIDPAGVKEAAKRQHELKRPNAGKTRTTSVKLTKVKVVPATESKAEVRKTVTRTVTAVTRSCDPEKAVVPEVPLVLSGTSSHKAAAAKKLESELAQDINDYFGGNDDVRRYCENWMCTLQSFFKVDQMRFDALRVLQAMIRARCFVPPFNLAIKKRYTKRELSDKLKSLDLAVLMSKEIRAAYTVNDEMELSLNEALSFARDVDRPENAYLIKRFDLWPRMENALKIIDVLICNGAPALPGEWRSFLISTRGTAVLMAAKQKLLEAVVESLSVGRGYALLGEEAPQLWRSDREKYLNVRRLIERQNPNAFDDFIYDKLKVEHGAGASLAQIPFIAGSSTCAQAASIVPEAQSTAAPSTAPQTETQTSTEHLGYPDWRTFWRQKSDAAERTQPPRGQSSSVQEVEEVLTTAAPRFPLFLRDSCDAEEGAQGGVESRKPQAQHPSEVVAKVERQVGDAVKKILQMKEEELPEKLAAIIRRARENVNRQRAPTSR